MKIAYQHNNFNIVTWLFAGPCKSLHCQAKHIHRYKGKGTIRWLSHWPLTGIEAGLLTTTMSSSIWTSVIGWLVTGTSCLQRYLRQAMWGIRGATDQGSMPLVYCITVTIVTCRFYWSFTTDILRVSWFDVGTYFNGNIFGKTPIEAMKVSIIWLWTWMQRMRQFFFYKT